MRVIRPKISVAPTIEKRKVPLRLANAVCRSREHLTDAEVAALMKTAAHVGRHGTRHAALILVAYRHGLRMSELGSLRWDQVDLQQGLLHVVRRKNGIASVHPLRGPELRTPRRLQRDYPHTAYGFVSRDSTVLSEFPSDCRPLFHPESSPTGGIFGGLGLLTGQYFLIFRLSRA